MVRTVGIDAGDYSIKAVELEGNYKKVRLLACNSERLADDSAGEEARATALAELAGGMLSGAKMIGDVVLGQACREAVLRTIDVPFKGTEAIRKVIKSEVESAIHSHAVDEMVVDFHEVGGVTEGSRVLVAAVPKQGLRTTLTALERAKVEPQKVDLDTMALFRVADWCGAFQAEPTQPADAVGGALLELGKREPLTAVLDLGSRSTRILLVEGSRLLDMRSMRLGDASIVDSLVRAHGLSLDVARTAVRACLEGKSDFQAEVAEQPVAAVAEGEADAAAPAAAVMRQVVIAHSDVEHERAAFVQRLHRELVRFLASTGRAGDVRGLWVTGGASRLDGVAPMLEEVFGIAPKTLDVLGDPKLKHSLSPEDAERFGSSIAVAVGLALANLGGPVGYDFRREDLAFTRGFDRVKFPLAIACMVALFAAVVFGVRMSRQLENLEYRIGLTYQGKEADPKKPKFYGQVNPVLRLGTLTDDRYFKFQEGSRNYGYKELLADVMAKPVAERIKFIRDRLRRALELKQKESGIYEEVSLESGLAVMERFLEVLHKNEGALGKYLLCTMELSMRATPGRDVSGRYLQCRFAFRGDDFRDRNAALRQMFDDECKREDSPFQKVEESIGGDLPFRDGAEKGVSGSYYDLKLHVRESFQPFGVGQ
jgi:Tfp pilus assembly PilM family ATPase